MTAVTQERRSLLRGEEPEWLVWVLVIILLSIGLVAKTIVTGRSQSLTEGNVSVRVPVSWVVLRSGNDSELLRVSEPLETALFPATVTVRQIPLAEMTDEPEATLGDLALNWSNRQTQDLLSYRVLSIEPAKITGRDGVEVKYVYVTEPALATPNSIPIVAEGQDVLFKQGDNLTIASFTSDADEYEANTLVWNRILNSLELK